jgi:hypothetical protein
VVDGKRVEAIDRLDPFGADVAIGTRLTEGLVGEDGGGRWLLNAWGCLRPSPHDGTLTQPMSRSTAFRRVPRPHFGKPNCPALSGEIRAAMVAAVGGESWRAPPLTVTRADLIDHLHRGQ